MNTFHEGQKVITRREKIGTVVRHLNEWDVLVRFGSREFEMTVGQLKSLDAHEAQMRGTRRHQDRI